MRLWFRRIALGLAGVLVLGVVTLLVYQRFSDGPTGPLAGGPFRSGDVMAAPVHNWSLLEGDFEFELVGQQRSRTAGGIMLDGELYITCDLGFIWARLPAGTSRNILHTIWLFKTWHHRAVEDGRIRIRKDGRVYSANVQRVEDPAIVEQLKGAIETAAAEFFAPNPLGPRPAEPPNDIWFFRVSP